ncbi:hypothetical protein BH10ACT2_BH10ACT2_09370 [soil metagenome]
MTFMAINIAVFIWMLIADPSSGSGDITQAHIDLDLYAPFLQSNHEWYRLVTSGFMHFGFLHIAFNMFALYQLGQIVERAMPHMQYALLYLASLLGGSLGALLVEGNHPSISAGASGAVFGLLGAAAVGLHRRGINIFSTGIGTALLLNLFITFSISGISIGGHLGGLAAGAICGYVMLAPSHRPIPKWAGYAVPIALGVVCVVVSVLYVNTLVFAS